MGHLRIRGHADLLRALVASRGRDPDAVSDDGLEARLAHLLELYPRPEVVGKGVPSTKDDGLGRKSDDAGSGADDDVRTPDLVPVPKRRPPLQARFFAVLQTREVPAKDEGLQSSTSPQPLTLVDCQPRDPGDPPPITPLVPRTRLWPALRRSLSHSREGRVDVLALVRRISRAESVRRLPRAARCSAGGEVWIVFDVAHRLIPYEQHFASIISEVRRLQGVANVHLWVVSDAPDAVLSVQHGRREMEAVSGRIPTPPAGTPVLILSDLGLLARDGQAAEKWTAFCQRMTALGARPVAWVPASSQLISRDAARHAQVHCLGAGDLRALKPARCVEKPPRPSAALRRLLTFIACCVRVEPALLRSLRLMSPDTAAEPGLEALVWSHPEEVRAGNRFCEIAGAAQAGYRAAFGALGRTEGGRSEQDEILRWMLAWHAYRGRSTESVELLIWKAHAGRDAPAGEMLSLMCKAERWVARLTLADSDVIEDIVAYSRDLIARQGCDYELMKRHSPSFSKLWALSGRTAIPPGLISRDLGRSQYLEGEGYFQLVQSGPTLVLVPRGATGEVFQGAWSFDVTISSGGFEWARSDGSLRHWFLPVEDALELPLGEASEGDSFHLISGINHYQIGMLSRPSWASEYGIESRGLYAVPPPPVVEGGRLFWYEWSDGGLWEGRWPPSGRAFQALSTPVTDIPGACMGADLKFGLYLDVSIGTVTQRFRWIEPGEFVMGSPDAEQDRFDDEGPQHVVPLTEGYWLADTACSQALWQAVTGGNPSHFKDDPQNPVEQVSWDDVNDFLRRLEARWPGVKAALPTEAEWEYACRAGTKTAFSFGDAITPEQANYDGSFSYGDGPKGEYREKTVPVKTFAANPWGLYQMHGNVWEWCADGWRTYDGVPQTYPRGPEGDAPRALRGGSWLFVPRGLRSAYRNDSGRDGRSNDVGFRLSLRSTSPEGGAERLPEAQVAPEGAPGKSPAPGRGRSDGGSKGSSARRNAGPTTQKKSASRKKPSSTG
jgi:formylglycine-generating enzyme required for sulfatase activity